MLRLTLQWLPRKSIVPWRLAGFNRSCHSPLATAAPFHGSQAKVPDPRFSCYEDHSTVRRDGPSGKCGRVRSLRGEGAHAYPLSVAPNPNSTLNRYLQTLRDLIADEPAEQGGVANEGATRGRTKHPRRGCAVRSATPKGGVSSSRAESVQRRKAEGSRPGSRRERRWVNWAALQPSEDDVALDASPLIAAPSSFAQLNRLAAVDEWEATPYDGADDSRAAPTPPVTSRIDRNLRPLVRKAPKDLVASIEETLIESFSEESSMVYLATVDCWNRALLHVSQPQSLT